MPKTTLLIFFQTQENSIKEKMREEREGQADMRDANQLPDKRKPRIYNQRQLDFFFLNM